MEQKMVKSDERPVESKNQILWKKWNSKASKEGVHHSIYWVKKNPKIAEDAFRGSTKTKHQKYVVEVKYTGDWKDNQKCGYGTQIWSNGSKYEGEWLENRRHGKGTMWIKEKQSLRKQYAGEWKADKREGNGIFVYSNGEKYEGSWRNNQRHGHGTLIQQDGSIYDGEWKEDKKCGLGSLTLLNGDKYEGYWLNDLKEGQGRYFYNRTKNVYLGEWQLNVPKCGIYQYYPFDEENVGEGNYLLPPLGLKNHQNVLQHATLALRSSTPTPTSSLSSGLNPTSFKGDTLTPPLSNAID